MNLWKSIFLASLFVWPLSSPGISRVGNGGTGVKSEVYGYTLTLPADFIDVQVFENENARFRNVKKLFFNTSLNEIDLRNFITEFPNLKSQPLLTVDSYLQGNGWASIEGDAGCGKLYVQETESTVARLRVWGSSKGYVLVAKKTPETSSRLDSIIQSTVLDAGACEW